MAFDDEVNETAGGAQDCPKCGGAMWDNREGKRNPKAPDFKCKDRDCGGVIWPPRGAVSAPGPSVAGASATAAPAPRGAAPAGMPSCPICGGAMWDDRLSKRNPRAPDFKCRNRPKMKGGEGCEGVIWPPREGQKDPYPPPTPRAGGPAGGGAPSAAARTAPRAAPPSYDAPPPDDRDFDPGYGGPSDDDLPF